jgi:hypothetical protein
MIASMKRRTEYDGLELKAYECTACGGGWHIGHATPRKERRQAERIDQ